jgi:hypothetical protein
MTIGGRNADHSNSDELMTLAEIGTRPHCKSTSAPYSIAKVIRFSRITAESTPDAFLDYVKSQAAIRFGGDAFHHEIRMFSERRKLSIIAAPVVRLCKQKLAYRRQNKPQHKPGGTATKQTSSRSERPDL